MHSLNKSSREHIDERLSLIRANNMKIDKRFREVELDKKHAKEEGLSIDPSQIKQVTIYAKGKQKPKTVTIAERVNFQSGQLYDKRSPYNNLQRGPRNKNNLWMPPNCCPRGSRYAAPFHQAQSPAQDVDLDHEPWRAKQNARRNPELQVWQSQKYRRPNNHFMHTPGQYELHYRQGCFHCPPTKSMPALNRIPAGRSRPFNFHGYFQNNCLPPREYESRPHRWFHPNYRHPLWAPRYSRRQFRTRGPHCGCVEAARWRHPDNPIVPHQLPPRALPSGHLDSHWERGNVIANRQKAPIVNDVEVEGASPSDTQSPNAVCPACKCHRGSADKVSVLVDDGGGGSSCASDIGGEFIDDNPLDDISQYALRIDVDNGFVVYDPCIEDPILRRPISPWMDDLAYLNLGTGPTEAPKTAVDDPISTEMPGKLKMSRFSYSSSSSGISTLSSRISYTGPEASKLDLPLRRCFSMVEVPPRPKSYSSTADSKYCGGQSGDDAYLRLTWDVVQLVSPSSPILLSRDPRRFVEDK